MMASEFSLFDPPARRTQETRSPSSTRSIRSIASNSSRSSRRSLIRAFLGLKPKEERADSPTLRFPSMASIASGDSASTSSSGKSSRSMFSNASSKPSIVSSRSTLTDLDLFGVKIPPTDEELAPTVPNAVELSGHAYKVPEPIDKEFYRDLTMLEDEELIRKYGLIKVSSDEEKARNSEMTVQGAKSKRATVCAFPQQSQLDIIKFA